MKQGLTVHVLEPGGEPAWQSFLSSSTNATLFHDLDFLAYHPPDRFHFHHLVVRSDRRIVAVVPGGLVEGEGGIAWCSPVGAPVGGPALAPRQNLGDVLAIVEALQQYAYARGWIRVDITLPPVAYDPRVGDVIGFALFRHGFSERQRWLSPMVDLSAVPAGMSPPEGLFERRKQQALRAAVRRGSIAFETGIEGLADFGRVFEETYARHGVRPTHTLDEIGTLMRRFPDRIRLMLAREGVHVTAGLLFSRVTLTVVLAVYLCRSTEGMQAGGPIVAIAGLLERLHERGYRWLDLGPSATDRTTNSGAMFFKQGLGAIGYSRSEWTWRP